MGRGTQTGPEKKTKNFRTKKRPSPHHARKRGRQSQATETKGAWNAAREGERDLYARTHSRTHSHRAPSPTSQKAQAKDYTDEDKAHLQKKKEEAAALKAARDSLLKGKKK